MSVKEKCYFFETQAKYNKKRECDEEIIFGSGNNDDVRSD
jgi:hypothetical protein